MGECPCARRNYGATRRAEFLKPSCTTVRDVLVSSNSCNVAMSLADQNRRKHPRLKVRVPIEFRPEGSGTLVGATADLSLGGCYLEMMFYVSHRNDVGSKPSGWSHGAGESCRGHTRPSGREWNQVYRHAAGRSGRNSKLFGRCRQRKITGNPRRLKMNRRNAASANLDLAASGRGGL